MIRAIAIAASLPYGAVYEALYDGRGVKRTVYEPYLLARGWRWTACMGIGTGCRVHLRADELPTGRLIVRLSRHLAAVIDGVLHDIADCSRGGTRCVYGYYKVGCTPRSGTEERS